MERILHRLLGLKLTDKTQAFAFYHPAALWLAQFFVDIISRNGYLCLLNYSVLLCRIFF